MSIACSHGPRAVGVDHQPCIRPDRLARGAHLRHGDLVQLDVAVAACHGAFAGGGDHACLAVAQQAGIAGQMRHRRGAEQPPQRQAGGLAGDVPQRDVERGQREHVRAVAAEGVERLRQSCAQPGNVARVLPEDGRRKLGVQHRLRGRGGGVAEALAPAFQPLVGDDAQPDRVHRLPAEAARHRGLAAHVERDAGPVVSTAVIFIVRVLPSRLIVLPPVPIPQARTQAAGSHPGGRQSPRRQAVTQAAGSHPGLPCPLSGLFVRRNFLLDAALVCG